MVVSQKILNLRLDTENPRFFDGLVHRTEPEIINYLLEYEEIRSLAQEINDYGGLVPGERIICTIEDGGYVVLEGNRRCAACKLLLNPQLIPPKFRNNFPHVTNTTKANIDNIEIDTVPSRDAAAYVLAKRHIDGPKKWGSLEKKRFHAFHFNRTKSIGQVCALTGYSAPTVKSDCQNYNFYLKFKSIFISKNPHFSFPNSDEPTLIWGRLY